MLLLCHQFFVNIQGGNLCTGKVVTFRPEKVGTYVRILQPFPPSPPDPWPWWRNAALGISGGILGGILIKNGLGIDDFTAAGLGALAGGRIISDLISPMLKGSSKI